MRNTSDLIAHHLYQAGCRFAFGMPGGEVLNLMDSLIEVGLRFILVKHENSGGFMAEGVYHVTGVPGILLTTLGPGVANAINVIANAYLDRIPLIFLTGRISPSDDVTYTHQVFDHQRVLRPITKASFMAEGSIDVLIDKAITIALEDRPGPVHIDVPSTIAQADQPEVPIKVRPRYGIMAPVQDDPCLDQARVLLADAQCPLMIAGFDVISQGGEKIVADFVQRFHIPLITTYKAKGILAEDHPLSLGGAGLSPQADKQLFTLIDQSDVILLAGYDPVEMRVNWRNPWSPKHSVIDFSSVSPTHGMHHASLCFIGNIAAGLKALQHNLKPRTPTWPDQQPVYTRRALYDLFHHGNDQSPSAFLACAREVIPKHAIVTVDTGAHRILMSQMWTCYDPRTLLQSNGLGTMGCALPLAIGVQLANPECPVVAFIGDASLEMVLGELATVRDLGLPIIVIVFVDRQLALIEYKQRTRGFTSHGVTFGATDFPAIAKAMKGYTTTVSHSSDLAKAIQTALNHRDRFTLITCPIDQRAYDGVL